MHHRGLLIATLCIAAACSASDIPGPATPSLAMPPSNDADADAWRSLQAAMPGTWQADVDGQPIQVSYRPSASGSVLVEVWMPGTPAETLSIYHLDGGRPMLTHYCGQGNQPRLAQSSRTATSISFERFDATNLTDEAAVLTQLTLSLEGDALRRSETYVRGAERETTSLEFRRIDPTHG